MVLGGYRSADEVTAREAEIHVVRDADIIYIYESRKSVGDIVEGSPPVEQA